MTETTLDDLDAEEIFLNACTGAMLLTIGVLAGWYLSNQQTLALYQSSMVSLGPPVTEPPIWLFGLVAISLVPLLADWVGDISRGAKWIMEKHDG